MRTLFKFEDELRHKSLALEHLEIWKDDIPCRFNDGDMIMLEVFETKAFLNIIKNSNIEIGDNPIVSGNRFERDTKGVYQVVWIHLDNWC